MIRKLKIAGLSILIIWLGFLREIIFVSTNYKIKTLTYNTIHPFSSELFNNFLNLFTLQQLLIFKWVMTFGYYFLFLVLTLLAIQLIYQTKKHQKLIIIIFLSILTLSFVSYGIGYVFDAVPTGYKYARILMGSVQSPFILLLLIPAIKLSKLQIK